MDYLCACPISHVPVVVCRLAGIRTRGRLTAGKDRQPEANRRTPPNGGRDLKQRRTGLFWSLLALQRSAPKEACLSCRACGRDISSSKRWLRSLEAAQPRARLGHGVAADRSSGSSMAFLSPSPDSRSGRVGGSTTA